jgi:short-subunit dehydrogenase
MVAMSRWSRALVTGASSGIGEAFVDELSTMNVDLILVGRKLDALNSAASRARSRGVRAEVLQADLSTEKGVTLVVEALRQATPVIDLLVNNAGVGQWGLFADLPADPAIETIRVNNVALVQLTYAAVAPMLEKGSGSIIQISSTASAGPGPQQAVYAATKAFVTSFGQALSAELAGSGVSCTTVLPGLTRTNYFSRAGFLPNAPEHRWMTAEKVAHVSLEAAHRARPLVIPGARNRWKIAVATQYPSLFKGRSKRCIRRTLDAMRRVRDHRDKSD